MERQPDWTPAHPNLFTGDSTGSSPAVGWEVTQQCNAIQDKYFKGKRGGRVRSLKEAVGVVL